MRPPLAALLAAALCAGCARPAADVATGSLEVSVDASARPTLRFAEPARAALVSPDVPAEAAFVGGREVTAFDAGADRTRRDVDDAFGRGEALIVRGRATLADGTVLEKESSWTRYADHPGLVVSRTTYTNRGEAPLTIDSVYSQRYRLRSPHAPAPERPAFWSFQAASYGTRPDWVLPLADGYRRYNFQGMNASDYGGGVPVVSVWAPGGGLAVGHLSAAPQLVALPVEMRGEREVEVRLVDALPRTLAPGESTGGAPTFVLAHEGDFFEALTTYAGLMARLGVEMPAFPETAYEPIWCAWGYGRSFDTKAVLATIPKVKELGLDWVVLDDGWQTAEGDWHLHPERFPRGKADVRAFVDAVHAEGLRAKLWWVPLAADPGTDLEREHPDWFLLDARGERQQVTWWDAHTLCPAVPEVRAHARRLVERFVAEWGFDGLKIDGQQLNAVAPCYNPAHGHDRPTASVEAVPAFFADVYRTATAARPDAVVELCPCGDAASFFNMAQNNQPVASDPLSSWQIRTKGKTFKALMGPDVPYYGDHVELSDGGTDFASTVGVGGVVGTKFTWAPAGSAPAWESQEEPASLRLTPEREAHWRTWIGLYRTHDLARGTYRGGLYDVGYDRPEAHAVEKDGAMYYAFYADDWTGAVELRGLGPGTYHVHDYVAGRDLGTVDGPAARLDVSFTGSLLLLARPE